MEDLLSCDEKRRAGVLEARGNEGSVVSSPATTGYVGQRQAEVTYISFVECIYGPDRCGQGYLRVPARGEVSAIY